MSSDKKESGQTAFDEAARLTFNERARADPTSGSVLAMHQDHANVYRDYISKVRLRQALRPAAGDEMLDFGCGLGRLAFDLASEVKRIEGVDRAEEMVRLAHERAERLGVQNVRFQHVVSNSLPFPLDAFTKVFSVWALQHTSDEAVMGVVRELHRVLVPRGRAVVIEQVEFVYRQPNTFNIHRTREQYKNLFTRAGFRVISCAHILRNPSRALAIWGRWTGAPRLALPLLAMAEWMLMDRKPEHVEYYTDRFVLEKE